MFMLQHNKRDVMTTENLQYEDPATIVYNNISYRYHLNDIKAYIIIYIYINRERERERESERRVWREYV